VTYAEVGEEQHLWTPGLRLLGAHEQAPES
jgi:hypothetical protein